MATKLPHSFSSQPVSIRHGKLKDSGDRLTVKGGVVFFGSIALFVCVLVYFFVSVVPRLTEKPIPPVQDRNPAASDWHILKD